MPWYINTKTGEKYYQYDKTLNPEIKNALLEKYNYTCQHCGKHDPMYDWKGAYVPLEAHHIKAKILNGSDDMDNFILLCRWCHRRIYHKGKNSVSALHKKAYLG